MSDHGTIWIRKNTKSVTLFTINKVDDDFVVFYERTLKPQSLVFPVDFGTTKLTTIDQWNARVADAEPLTKEVLDDLRCIGNKPVH